MFSLRSTSVNLLLITSVLVLFLSAALLQNPLAAEKQKLSPGSIISPEKSAKIALGFLGGFRTSIAAMLWIKMDRVHHEYYGNLFEEKEMIPLYRLVTWLDPNFIYAYYVGSYVVFINNQPEKALQFAIEGVAANPESSLLNYNAGQLYLLARNNYPKARVYLEKALRLSKDDVEKYNALVTLLVVYEKQKDLEKFHAVEEELRKYPVQPKFMEKAEEELEHDR